MSSLAIIKHHFGIEDTLIVGNVVYMNQVPFHIDEIDKMCELMRVNDEKKQEIIAIHKTVTLDELSDLVYHQNYIVRIALAFQGIELDKLTEDPFWYVRYYVAQQKHNLNVLKEDDHKLVKWTALHLLKLQENK